MNIYGDIDAFNPVTQSMFGFTTTEIVGKQLYNLFDEHIIKKMQYSVGNMIQHVKNQNSNASTSGEIFETECIRKNKTKFPAKDKMHFYCDTQRKGNDCLFY